MLTRLSATGELVVAILSVILPAIGDPGAAEAATALPFFVAAAPLLLALLGRFLVSDIAERGLNLSDNRSFS